MTELIHLAAGECTAVLDPDQGGRLASFTIAGHELLVPHGADIFHWGSFVLAPWVGRLRNGLLTFDGEEHRLPINGAPHALHGLVTDRAWRVEGDGRLSIDLAPPWPWPGRVIQTATLHPDRFEFAIEVHSEQRMPVDVGWHPWFNRHLVGPDGTRSAEVELDVAPALMYADAADRVPDGRLVPPVPRPWDYCFVDLAAPPVLRWPGLLELEVRSECPYWVLYDMEEEGVCVEPWTGPPNSLNLPNPTTVGPGRPLRATMTWAWRWLSR
ncbi:aldose 1-epimerase [Micromonospora okii]|uniref:aldose 1-epimerase n=1 Tax=Micromonospora okii TaxID=1182970 RepID=UPI001E4C6F52|nr:hypothetical protein [Micromonospora okii]